MPLLFVFIILIDSTGIGVEKVVMVRLSVVSTLPEAVVRIVKPSRGFSCIYAS